MKLSELAVNDRFRFTETGAHACSFDRDQAISTEDVYCLLEVVPDVEYVQSGGGGEPAIRVTEYKVTKIGEDESPITLTDNYEVAHVPE